MSSTMRRGDEDGSALVELTWLGILLLIPMLWIVLSVFEVQRGAFGVSGAARAAGAGLRAGARTTRSARRAPSRRLGRRSPTRGCPARRCEVTVTCTPYPADCHSGTSVITVRVRSRVDLPLLPDVLGGGSPSFALDASHTVPIGQYQEVRDAAP